MLVDAFVRVMAPLGDVVVDVRSLMRMMALRPLPPPVRHLLARHRAPLLTYFKQRSRKKRPGLLPSLLVQPRRTSYSYPGARLWIVTPTVPA